jgi:hypothetical protein
LHISVWYKAVYEGKRCGFLRSYVQIREYAKGNGRGWCRKLQDLCGALLFKKEIAGPQKHALQIEGNKETVNSR